MKCLKCGKENEYWKFDRLYDPLSAYIFNPFSSSFKEACYHCHTVQIKTTFTNYSYYTFKITNINYTYFFNSELNKSTLSEDVGCLGKYRTYSVKGYVPYDKAIKLRNFK